MIRWTTFLSMLITLSVRRGNRIVTRRDSHVTHELADVGNPSGGG